MELIFDSVRLLDVFFGYLLPNAEKGVSFRIMKSTA